eukprot:16431826-Heterocapsa_arctica.AAC.1
MLPSSGGMAPLRLLLFNFKTCRSTNKPKKGGMAPLIWLSLKSRISRIGWLAQEPVCGNARSLMLLPCKSRVIRRCEKKKQSRARTS